MSANYGIENGILREPARVIMHLPEAWTQILLIRTYGLGMADGGIYWEIPTAKIPEQLRKIGSVFLVETPLISKWIEDSEERHKKRFEDLYVFRLTPEEEGKYSNPPANG